MIYRITLYAIETLEDFVKNANNRYDNYTFAFANAKIESKQIKKIIKPQKV